MEMFSAPWWSALLAIILIDLVLAGDNAIVIALAARNLPAHLQRKAIIWGTVGAIAVRAVMTLVVVWLLKIPGLMLVGGIGLIWIAYRLIAPAGSDEHQGPSATTFVGAMKTIVIADALMGVDNVLGVAGAAHGSFDLVVIGLLISVPLIIFGSTLVLKVLLRYPLLVTFGAGLLIVTSSPAVEVWARVDAAGLPRGRVRVVGDAGLGALRDALAVATVGAVPRRASCSGRSPLPPCSPRCPAGATPHPSMVSRSGSSSSLPTSLRYPPTSRPSRCGPMARTSIASS